MTLLNLKLLVSIFFVLFVFSNSANEIIFDSRPQTIYSSADQFRINIKDGQTKDNILLTITTAISGEELNQNKDFIVLVEKYGLVISLLNRRDWISDFNSRIPPVALILSNARYASEPGTNILKSPIIIAQLLGDPQINKSSNIVFSSSSAELVLNGIGLIGANKLDLIFNPILQLGIDYEIVTKLPLFDNEIVLRLIEGKNWRRSTGQLLLTAIDTGGGLVEYSHPGVVVADIKCEELDIPPTSVIGDGVYIFDHLNHDLKQINELT